MEGEVQRVVGRPPAHQVTSVNTLALVQGRQGLCSGFERRGDGFDLGWEWMGAGAERQ